jgi:hypothetical protein
MSGSASFQRVSLSTDPRCPLRGLLCWRERDQRNAHDNKRRYVTQQMSALARILECLHRP